MQKKLKCWKIRILLHILLKEYTTMAIRNFNLLGVLFDEYLNFDDPIKNWCSKISKSLFCINRIKTSSNWNKRPKRCYILPWSTRIWFSLLTSTAVQTQRILISWELQKEALRIISNAGSTVCSAKDPPYWRTHKTSSLSNVFPK
jgi:hypothetical protein